MGTFLVTVALPDRTRLQALIDTGATFSKLPSSVLRRLGVRVDFVAKGELGDGRRVRRKVGYARLAVAGRRALVPVMFGPRGEPPLLGATTLEILGLAPDPIRRTLVESTYLEVSERSRR